MKLTKQQRQEMRKRPALSMIGIVEVTGEELDALLDDLEELERQLKDAMEAVRPLANQWDLWMEEDNVRPTKTGPYGAPTIRQISNAKAILDAYEKETP